MEHLPFLGVETLEGGIPLLILWGWVVCVGLLLGSFATALTYRFEHHLPFAWDRQGHPVRSMCPPCGRTLTIPELVPVFSWVCQKGRCRCGKILIPWTYPAIEISVAALVSLLFFRYGWTFSFGLRTVCIPFLIAMLINAIKRNKNAFLWPKGLRAIGFWAGSLVFVLFFNP